MSGTFLAIVGPSGAGKDRLMAYASEKCGADLVIVRRVVTRAVDGKSEDHDSMTPEQFALAENNGRFALSWEAHGLCYGLPADLNRDLATGRVVMANLSRAVLPRLIQLFPAALVVEVIAAPDIISARLRSRGREDAAEIQKRLERGAIFQLPPGTIRIDNSGPIEVAGEQLVRLVRECLRHPAQALS
jgi:ribose 1,5-bisphosphokinase